ncbi:MAG: penicillin acylase family protein, partial [Chloroflexi bacterium]|nr:penicillin acylase family protein [Chloroflexota bacterium]
HPYGGDMNTVNQAMSGAWRRESRVAVAPGFRQVLDLADWDASVFMLPTGNSGIPGHPRYDDCIGEYLAGGYRPLVFSRAAVEAAAEATLTIEPRSGDEAHR